MRHFIRRAGFFLVTLWAALTINFLLPRLMPGNPAVAMMRHVPWSSQRWSDTGHGDRLGVNTKASLLSQYFTYLGNSFTGHWGISLTFFPSPVASVVLAALPWTIGLVGVTTVLAFILGTLIGIVGAWNRGKLFDSLLPPIFIVLSAFPYFFLGLMAILIFSVKLGWFPTSGAYTNGVNPAFDWSYISNVLQHAVLPGLTILVTSIGGWILTMRNNMIGTLSEDYIRMSRAKGLSSRLVMFNYAARNAILPNLTGFGMSLGFVVSGAILVEYVFAYPGVGYMLLQAVVNEDYPLMQTLFLFITVAVLLAVLIADGVVSLLDPRARSAK